MALGLALTRGWRQPVGGAAPGVGDSGGWQLCEPGVGPRYCEITGIMKIMCIIGVIRTIGMHVIRIIGVIRIGRNTEDNEDNAYTLDHTHGHSTQILHTG